VAELERLATEICEYAPTVIPGLLQTREYARAVFLAGNPLATDEHIEELVQGRMDRTQLLKDATRPVYWAVLHETALRIPVGDAGVMACQLDHIATLMRERAVLVQMLRRASYDHIRAAALSPEASLAMIESLAEDYRRCASTT
jgi:hypothetical protein